MARKRKQRLPVYAEAEIQSMAHDGRGVAHVDGKTVFIDGALPEETVRFFYTRKRRDIAEGRVDTVIKSSSQRAEPGCEFYGTCGGCSFQHLAPEQQIMAKQAILLDQFRRIGKLEPPALWPPLRGPHWGYRHRARLGVKYVIKKGRVLVGFREKGSPYLADIGCCPVLHPAVGMHLLDLSALIESLSITQKIPQIEVAVGDERVALVFRVLEAPDAEDRLKMAEFAKRFEYDIYLQPKGPDSIKPLDGPPQPLSYGLPQDVELQFGPSDFVQVNPAINQQMISRALEVLQLGAADRVLDLFCGLGNFSLPMARLAGQVTGVEGSEDLIRRASENARANDLDGVQFHTADLMQPIDQESWARGIYNKVLIDPPRTGAKEVLPYLKSWQAEQVLYISCNPSTLARDASILVHEMGYELVQAGVMDMFPHTSHVESMALFVKPSRH